MKEVVKIPNIIKRTSNTEIITAAIWHLSVVLYCFAASRAVVLKGLMPFGLAVLAGCPSAFTASAAIGAFLGYFIPAIEGGAFRYLAVVFALLSVKLLLSGYKKIISSPIILSVISFTVCAFSGIVSSGGISGNALSFIVEALLSAAAAYFIALAGNCADKFPVGLLPEETASVIILINILLMGFSGISASGISLSNIFSVFLILTSAKFGGISAGAVSGISVAFSFLLTGNFSAVTVGLAMGGMLAGVFVSFGKYAQIVALVLCAFIGTVSGGLTLNSVGLLIEIALGSSLFLLLPRNLRIILGKFFSSQPKLSSTVGIKKALTVRLGLASEALSDVSETVEQVSRELSRINAPDFGTVINRIEGEACAGCRLRIHCWERMRESTVAAVCEMTKAVKNAETHPENAAGEDFCARCLRTERLGNCVYRHYSDYAAKISAENRLDEVRSAVTDQFDGISKMLYDLATDFKNDEKFDATIALSAAAALKNLGLRAEEASCRIDKFGRMSLEMRIKKTSEQRINKMHIMKLMSIVCERNFDPPVISETGGSLFLTLTERAEYTVEFGTAQSSAGENSMCGDAYTCFNDGKGHFIIILSDGMGTGGRAAVDSAMASGLMMRLLKAGFGYDCSLKILNSSMLFKSTDESLATLDIVSIDLYTGETTLYKAGAAPTLIRRSGRAGKAESRSLPAGILRDIGFDFASIKIKSGDIVLMMSDGAVSCGTDWIRTELEAWSEGKISDLAEHICECAKRRYGGNRPDDITVLAAKLEKKAV